jgi:hypothetical protein
MINQTNKSDPWELESLRLPETFQGTRATKPPPPRHKPGETFLPGPIPFDWMATACRLEGSGLHVASTVLYLVRRFQCPNRWGLAHIASALEISERTARRGLNLAEEAGLVLVEREPGCKLVLNVPKFPKLDYDPAKRPFRGPVPWLWWASAAKLPGISLQVAAVCWFKAGLEHSAEVEICPSECDILRHSRYAFHAGLECLKRAGLVSEQKRTGLKSVVRLLDAPG